MSNPVTQRDPLVSEVASMTVIYLDKKGLALRSNPDLVVTLTVAIESAIETYLVMAGRHHPEPSAN